MTYKHGLYGEVVPSKEVITTTKGTIPFYVGTAPVHRLANSKDAINRPILIKNLDEAATKLGYQSTDDFDTYTLSSVVYAHFQNSIKPIGPIIAVNVLDAEIHKSTTATETITLVEGKGYIEKDVILSTVKIATKVLGTDYTAEYTKDGKVLITSLNGSLGTSASASYNSPDISKVTTADVIGSYSATTEERTGIKLLDVVYEELNLVPNIISAPGFNHKPEVEKALVNACQNYGGRWNAIPVVDIDSDVAKNIVDAKKWATANGYNSRLEKLCWPKGKVDGRSIWMSIIAIVDMQQTDNRNNGIPYESPSNKQIGISGLSVNGKDIRFNIVQANELNEVGITTAIYNGGKWVLWGPHMANFKYGEDIKIEDVFDVNARMNIYLLNDFKTRNVDLIDSPIARNDIDGILNTEQLKLNSLISDGKLLYGSIEFMPASNPVGDVIQGEFVFDSAVTTTPPGKAITNRVQYTSAGIGALVGGGE
ncbi:hypothetical protein [Clostridium cylindrosporum]|uniref:Phage tail sheath protein FI n=1 Tax=Clostridium cylindrosporum DSM 605 TaxID=1121307 RepID=A0A0J8DB08_CLOCY|nr:hypothetical protein [Clostridium cylindrosporum]KMT23007.1 phage tail sheath protein FI [Clostridium cylindrosporum DSM 605]